MHLLQFVHENYFSDKDENNNALVVLIMGKITVELLDPHRIPILISDLLQFLISLPNLPDLFGF